MKRIMAMALCLAICLMSLAGIGGRVAYAESDNLLQGYEKITDTQNLTLYYNMSNNSLAIVDKRNGYTWRSDVDQDKYDVKNVNDTWKNYMTSLFAINYTDIVRNEGSITKAYSATKGNEVNARKINNGIAVDYTINPQQISLTVEFSLDGNSLVVRVPADKIIEKSKYAIVSLELMPFFGAADRTVDGYMFCPDGCGAIMKYQNIENRAKDLTMHTWSVYGRELVTSGTPEKPDYLYQAMLPVFGVKNGSNAFLAALTDGAADAAVNLTPEGNALNVNRVSFEYKYRHFYDKLLSAVVVNSLSSVNSNAGKKADKEILRQDREQRYMFLYDKEANYSGMANAYRSYLISNNLIKDAVDEKSEMPLALTYFMGLKENRILFDRFITMTSFEQAKAVTGKFIDSGVKQLQVSLKGWGKGGYGIYPQSWPPEKKLGGEKGLNAFSQFTQQNNIKLFLQSNFTDASKNDGKLPKRSDLVVQGNNTPVGGYWFLMNPLSSLNRLKGMLSNFKQNTKAGIAFETLGKLIYQDYNKNAPSTREQTVETWKNALSAASEKNNGVAAEGGNEYVLKYADRIFNVPIKSSNYYITDEDVPFYQMVVHGSVPYSSEPGNLFYDFSKQKLQWVEYGCIPFYELTYAKSKELNSTQYCKLFTSYYADWMEQAVSVYKEFNSRLQSVWGQKMVGHEKLSDTLYAVKYDNETTIYINYGEAAASYDGYSIKAKDYLVVQKGGITK